MTDYRVVIDFVYPFSGVEVTYDHQRGQARLTVPFDRKADAELAASRIKVTVQDISKTIAGQLAPMEIESA
jgi:hypothetical protein